MAETVWTPLILSASFTPNPAISGETTLLSVSAVDVFGAEQTEARYSSEFYSGEV